jgi:hypothetical protein
LKDELAEALLAKVMSWGAAEVAAQRALLQDLARYKYDEYQQFAPGQRFIESLALWLRQFNGKDARTTAYNWVRHRLIFLSASEINHLVASTFPTIVRPWLLQKAAEETGLQVTHVKALADSEAYRLRLRQTLFLGLSDGAHIDQFRRANPALSNEQIWHAYDFSPDKAEDFRKKLAKDLESRLGRAPTDAEARYKTVCLLDDFTASGKTYLRDENGTPDGKIAKIWRKLKDTNSEFSAFVDQDNVEILIIIYIAAAQAINYLDDQLPKQLSLSKDVLRVVHKLPASSKVEEPEDQNFLKLVADDRYFDGSVDDEHAAVGGDSMRYGFSDCRLPVVLNHNTPNNSLFLLWGGPEHRVRGLFPRISRHRRFV